MRVACPPSRFIAFAPAYLAWFLGALLLGACGGTNSNPPGSNTFTISGSVRGATLQGVSIALGGAATETATTDGSGNYSFAGLANGSYTVTPGSTAYGFAPLSASVTVNGADETVFPFEATVATSISGYVTGAQTAGVVVGLVGPGIAAPGTTTLTDANGNYRFTGLDPTSQWLTPPGDTDAGNDYVVTPVPTAAISFFPLNASVIANGAASVPPFTSTPGGTFVLSGSVTGGGPQGISASVALTGAATEATSTDANGYFSFYGLSPGAYVVTPTVPAPYVVFSPSTTAGQLQALDESAVITNQSIALPGFIAQ